MLRDRRQQCEALDGLLADVRTGHSRVLVVRAGPVPGRLGGAGPAGRGGRGAAATALFQTSLSARSSLSVFGQDYMELVAGADVEFGEDLVQVVLDGARAHEQLGGDLGVGQAADGQPGDLGLPGGELGGGIGCALAYALAGS